ncbi:MAG: GTP 3',8-cyclase MoaA [Clostridiales bacterium]|nr:GTP 3',8-cyclase MoaA [Clostridiales bacterium]
MTVPLSELYSYGRKINYLRLSITDKCNLRCRYCIPEEGLPDKSHGSLLRVEEMLRLLALFRNYGIDKLRITGGEPLVSRQLLPLLAKLTALDFADIALTTNGQLLSKMANQLKAHGIKRLNISLDTLNAERFTQLTRGGNLQDTLAGLETALKVGFASVKVNCVLMRGLNDSEIHDIALLAQKKPLSVRFIEFMPVGINNQWSEENFLSISWAKEKLAILGEFIPYEELYGNGPAEVFSIAGYQGSIGFIDAVSGHFCHNCNRLRLTADGLLHPCLHSASYIDLLSPLRAGADDPELRYLIEKAINEKPPQHEGWGAQQRKMCSIGG